MQDRFKYRVKFETDGQAEIFDVTKLDMELGQIFFKREDGRYYNIGIGCKDVELMQCIDLKDKTGKLIYENDIIFNNCGQWIIKYCDKCKSFQCFDNTYGCFACEGDYNWYDFIEDLDKTTVIGNIYENKELLEAK